MSVHVRVPRPRRFGPMKAVIMFTALALTPLAAFELLVAMGAG